MLSNYDCQHLLHPFLSIQAKSKTISEESRIHHSHHFLYR
ncbi:hypothetical protein LINPERPRIM_LOCUS2134 [Linum perenne]